MDEVSTRPARFRHGDRIGPYEITRARKGLDGFGETYTARNRDGDSVLLKVAWGRARYGASLEGLPGVMAQVGRLSSRLVPVPPLLDMDRKSPPEWAAFPILLGRNLRDRMAEPFTARKADEMARRLVTAVEGLHSIGLVHGGLSPTNVWVNPDESICLLDLGCTAFDQHDLPERERTFSMAWVAPEMWTGQPPSPASDLWALGYLLTMVYGRSPQGHAWPVSITVPHLSRQVEIPVPLRSALPIDGCRQPRAEHRISASLGRDLLTSSNSAQAVGRQVESLVSAGYARVCLNAGLAMDREEILVPLCRGTASKPDLIDVAIDSSAGLRDKAVFPLKTAHETSDRIKILTGRWDAALMAKSAVSQATFFDVATSSSTAQDEGARRDQAVPTTADVDGQRQAWIFLLLFLVSEARGQTSDALEFVQRADEALGLDGSRWVAYQRGDRAYLMAMVEAYMRLGHPDQAQARLSAVLERSRPLDSFTAEHLALMFLDIGDVESAEQIIRRGRLERSGLETTGLLSLLKVMKNPDVDLPWTERHEAAKAQLFTYRMVHRLII